MWKVIPFETEYEVSLNGEVRNKNTKHIKSSRVSESGYYRVTLYPSGKSYSAHRLVAMTWIENPNGYPVVNHLNGNKKDNKVSNLEWCTVQQNTRHAIDVTKTMICANWKGDKNPLVTLYYGLVYSIKFGVLSRLPIKTLASMFGLREDTFRKILRNETWNHVIRLD